MKVRPKITRRKEHFIGGCGLLQTANFNGEIAVLTEVRVRERTVFGM